MQCSWVTRSVCIHNTCSSCFKAFYPLILLSHGACPILHQHSVINFHRFNSLCPIWCVIPWWHSYTPDLVSLPFNWMMKSCMELATCYLMNTHGGHASLRHCCFYCVIKNLYFLIYHYTHTRFFLSATDLYFEINDLLTDKK